MSHFKIWYLFKSVTFSTEMFAILFQTTTHCTLWRPYLCLQCTDFNHIFLIIDPHVLIYTADYVVTLFFTSQKWAYGPYHAAKTICLG
jgi:hypothetical protein